MPDKTILIMAGGTGGHVYPALAVADYLRDHGDRLYWLGTRSGLEARIVPENGLELLVIYVSGLRGKKFSRWIIAPVMLMMALVQSMRILIKYKPDAVIGLGGFVSGPGGIAAWLLRIPLYIHEQNAIAGLTNRLLAPLAKKVMLGFPGALNGKNVIATGNPVRKSIQEIAPPTVRLAGRSESGLRLLVLGGSLGAKALNELMPEVLSALPADLRIDTWHQTGGGHVESTRNLYQKYKLTSARVVSYIEDMAEAYSWADLVLCRAGASTVSEICNVGVAAILVPYPHAVDDHQTANAKYLSDAGAAILIPQTELSVTAVVSLLGQFASERNRLVNMATIARSKAYIDATPRIAAICSGGDACLK